MHICSTIYPRAAAHRFLTHKSAPQIIVSNKFSNLGAHPLHETPKCAWKP